MNTSDLMLSARVAALFASDLSVTLDPAPAELNVAIRESVRSHGGIRGCTAEMAAKYGDYPEIAVPRVCWARRVVTTAYPLKARRDAVVAHSVQWVETRPYQHAA